MLINGIFAASMFGAGIVATHSSYLLRGKLRRNIHEREQKFIDSSLGILESEKEKLSGMAQRHLVFLRAYLFPKK